MIALTTISGEKTYLAPAAIAQVTEAGVSGRWHGIQAIVKTFDRRTIEVREEAAAIVARLNAGDQP